jgi:small nuclear ribonucleoprotein (snRNP)-like protein
LGTEPGATGLQEKTEEQKRKDAEKKAFLCQRAVQYMDAVHEAATRDPIEQIAKRVRKGPLMLLKRAYQSACEIDITTRHARGIRGVIRATLHGFDKYMNMLLADGHEMFVVRQRVFRLRSSLQPAAVIERKPEEESIEADEPDGQTVKTRVGWKQVLRQRKLARIMLRGDQVVTITFAQGDLTLPPCLAHVQRNVTKEE